MANTARAVAHDRPIKAVMALLVGLIALLAAPSAHAENAERPAWVNASFFTPPPDGAPAQTAFEGTLHLQTTPMTVTTARDGEFVRFPWAWWDAFDFLAAQDPGGTVPLFALDSTLFPGLTAAFTTCAGGALVPLERGVIRERVAQRTESFWEMVVGPGRTWAVGAHEPEWAGWNRAAFPISLVNTQEGQAWVGLGAVHYRADQVSDLFVVFGDVAGGGFVFPSAPLRPNAWTRAPTRMSRSDPTLSAQACTAFAVESEARLTRRPLADFRVDVDGLTPEAARDTRLAMAVLDDGVLYASAVDTPFGPHPYPGDMRVGVWSVTKSLVAGMAALRLAERYGTAFLDIPLVAFFEEGAEFAYADEAARRRWGDVTIRHALDLRTGMGPRNADENWGGDDNTTYRWAYAYDDADKIRAYFSQRPNPDVSGPDQAFAYLDQDLWIGVVAMERYLQSKEGPTASILAMLNEEVYGPLGAQPFVATTSYAADGSPGAPFSSWGALPTVELLAKAGRLLADGGRGPDGVRLLHAGLLEELYAAPDYALGFWKTPIDGGGHALTMSGAGANYVIAPNDGAVAVILGKHDYDAVWPDPALQALASVLSSTDAGAAPR